MRKKTLAAVCSVLAFGILFAMRFMGVRVPLMLATLFAFLVLVPLLMIPLTPLNKRLLAWRKARGRDIEEEEQYEIGAVDMISLRPRSERPPEPEDNRHLPALFR